jgi:hypothetical protein
VYKGIYSLLKEGISLLGQESNGNPGNYDFFYNGDVESWIKAANALLMRYYNRLSNINEAYADSVLSVVDFAIDTASANMVFKSYTTNATGQNPWYQLEVSGGYHAVSKTIDDILVGLNDPRREIFFGTIANGTITPATPGGSQSDQAGALYSKISSSYLQDTTNQPLITYDEVKFIEAEANYKKGNVDEAYKAYIEAVDQALLRVGVDSSEKATYLAQPTVAVGVGGLTESVIITQKYIALWLFLPIEAYNDYRRTRIPTMKNAISVPPERFPYPSDEVANNAANVPAKGTTVKVWWAK